MLRVMETIMTDKRRVKVNFETAIQWRNILQHKLAIIT